MRSLRQVRVFLASPGDVRRERKHVEDVVTDVNRTIAESRGIVLRVVSWKHDAHPDYGPDGQAVLNSQIASMDDINIFVGLMWRKTGTSTPRARSGTIEEFERAVDAWKRNRQPSIWFYFRTGRDRYDSEDELLQRRDVLAFRKEVQKHGLPWDYESPSSFKDLFREHLVNWVTRFDSSRSTTPTPGAADGRNAGINAGEIPPSPENVQRSGASIRFVDLLTPDEVSMELFFMALLKLAREALPVDSATAVRLPKTHDESRSLEKAVLALPVSIEWPAPIKLARDKVEADLREIVSYAGSPETLGTSSWRRDMLRSLTYAQATAQHLATSLPARLPHMWLALLDYSGPFPERSQFTAQLNYLRFSSLLLYRLLVGARTTTQGGATTLAAQGLLDGPRWEFQIHRFFDTNEDIAVAYVTSIEGVALHGELCIYGPRESSLLAYRQSMNREPITSNWFMDYLVPQVELHMALNSPATRTRYEERAWIRKVVDLSGRNI
jgi:hypothetical protein